MNRLLAVLAALIGVHIHTSAPLAQVTSLTLSQVLEQTDDCVHGVIRGREVIRIDHPIDGPGLFYTTLRIEGRSLISNSAVQVDVTFPGGFIDEREGVFNSEAPAEDEIAVGRTVVAFHGWSDNMGGDLAGHALWGSHGGLYPCTQNRRGEAIVLGRGAGYPISTNQALDALALEIEIALFGERRRGDGKDAGERLGRGQICHGDFPR